MSERRPTGTQIVLDDGRVRAEIATVAAQLRSLTVDGVAITEPTPADTTPPFCNGIVLSPWPNRVRDGRWTLDGDAQQLDLTEPERGNALHGLLVFADYAVTERTDDAVTLTADVHPQHGWPFLLHTWVTYSLARDGLTVVHGVENRSGRPAPYAVGTHPFLRVGDVPVEELVLTAPAERYIDVDDRLNPLGERPVEGTRFDLRSGRRVGDLDLDTAYAGVTHAQLPGDADGALRGASAWLEAPDGRRVTLWQNRDWDYLQVFTTREFPKNGGTATAVAVEPMTAPPDALNSNEGLRWLDPGERWQGSWGLRYTP